MALKILLLDNDSVASTLAGRLLARLDHALPAREIESKSATDLNSFDLVLIDVDTVNAAQIEAFEHLIQSRDWPRPRVISMSADRNTHACSLAGYVDAHLTKPLTLQSLAEALARVCPGSEPVAGSRHFNPAKWRSLLALFGQDGLTELVDTLVKDLPEQQERLQQVRQDDDLVGLRRLAHGLRGACQQLGAAHLAAAASLTEDAALAGASAPAFARGSRLVGDYAELVGRLESELARL